MTPVLIQDEISIAANTTVENVIASNTGAQRYIRAPFDSIGQLFANQSATGLRMELVVDGQTIMDSSDPRVSSSSLQTPDDLRVEQFSCRQGGQIVLRVSNTTGGALTFRYRITMAESQAPVPLARSTMRGPTALAANTTVQVMTGLRFERAVRDSLLKVLATGSAVGLTLEVFVDGNSVAPALPMGNINRMPQNPYDTLLDGIECPQDKLIELRISNTTGGALNFFWMTILQEMF